MKSSIDAWWKRVFKCAPSGPLTEAHFNRHVEMRSRSATSLLTALRLSNNLDYLREAYERSRRPRHANPHGNLWPDR